MRSGKTGDAAAEDGDVLAFLAGIETARVEATRLAAARTEGEPPRRGKAQLGAQDVDAAWERMASGLHCSGSSNRGDEWKRLLLRARPPEFDDGVGPFRGAQ